MEKESIKIEPKLSAPHQADFLRFCYQIKRALNRRTGPDRWQYLAQEKLELNKSGRGKIFHSNTDLIFVKHLLLDLLLQDWSLKIHRKKVSVEFETADGAKNLDEEKLKTRRRHLLARDSQLREPSVVDFVKSMEKRRLTQKGWHSIFSVMRDGADLKRALDHCQSLATPDEKIAALENVISPYIQIVEPNTQCDQTGLELPAIWRYFRHTWTTEYKSLPGRSISILIRDRAAPNHPVIGIAALGSSVAQQTVRDHWIGWEGETFLKKISSDPSVKYAQWIIQTLKSLLSELYLKDFIAGRVITVDDIKTPQPDKLKQLRDLSVKYRERHVNNPQSAKFSTGNNEMTWEQRALTNLFKSKRALLLADLLSIRLVFNKYQFAGKTKQELINCLQHADFRNAVIRLTRKAKAIHVGINMMDIIVCGSIQPYNHLLGGKLICMLLTSPEITQYYNRKYNQAVSLIASSMRGKALVRKPQLVMMGTTSLYGVGSSQYNRVKIPVSEVGGKVDMRVEYKELGVSEGYGSFHFSGQTISLADAVAGRENGRTRVNSIFGEGANPLLRKLKDAMEYLDLESNPILNHRNKRVVYGISLAENFGDVLLGIASRPKYLMPQQKPKLRTELIGKYWIRRWLFNRIGNQEVLEQLALHTLSYPIIHGARVPLPDEEKPPTLFD